MLTFLLLILNLVLHKINYIIIILLNIKNISITIKNDKKLIIDVLYGPCIHFPIIQNLSRNKF